MFLLEQYELRIKAESACGQDYLISLAISLFLIAAFSKLMRNARSISSSLMD